MIPSRPSRSTGGRNRTAILVVVILLVFAGVAGVGLVGTRVLDRLDAIDSRVTELASVSTEANDTAERALERAEKAASAAEAAADARRLAEAGAKRAEEDARISREDAETAREETERIRQETENELNRLSEALGKIAETRRTALGLVMNLGEESIKFGFDEAILSAADRELLSRIAGILMTSDDYAVYVNGHTDDVGTAQYNQTLSERRARAVRDYLVKTGIDERIMTVEGFGKTQPIAKGTTAAARARNRRVELGIVNARIRYPHASRN